MHLRKNSFFIHSSRVLLLFFLICTTPLYAAIYSRPRRVFVIQTEYFEYIFPRGAEQTACYLAKNGDALFEKAAEQFSLQKTFRIPVAISLDSDVLSVSYTATPYNRITVFQAPGEAQNCTTDDALLSAFAKSITEAVASSVRSPFWQFASDFLGMDALQPAALLNIPAAFMDGIINAAVYSDGGGIMEDCFSLELLSRAKKEGCFPTWNDASGAKDTYPVQISQTACSAFAAYIQQRWGMELFAEFWKQCGSVQFFKLTPGIFKKVYKIPLKEAWKDFENSIPVPQTVSFGTEIFKGSTENLYSLLTENHGMLIYFDYSKNAVFSLDKKQKRKRIFIAENITSLSPSPDGNYIAVSYKAEKTNRKLTSCTTQVFDLQKKLFQPEFTNIRNGTFFEEKEGKTAIAGFYAKDSQVQLKVFPFYETAEKTDMFTFALPENIQTEGIVPLGTGKLLCIYYYKKDCILQTVNTITRETAFYKLPVQAKNFTRCETPDGSAVFFTYTDGTPYSVSKAGYIPILEKGGALGDVYLAQDSVDGGMNGTCVADGTVYFSSSTAKYQILKQADFNDLEKLSFIAVQKIEIEQTEMQPADIIPVKIEKISGEHGTEKYLSEFKITKYKPIHYIFKGTWFPFFPISSFDFTKTSLAPGLGATYYTSTDPLETMTAALSFCAGFIDLSQKTFTLDDNFTLASTINTTILPFDLSLSGIWSFDSQGHYDLQAMLGVSWNHFLGMSFHHLSFGLKMLWKCTTTYIDYETNTTTELDGWPNIADAYNTLSSYFNITYSNYHQSGMTSFEQYGIETGATLINIYDPQKSSKEEENSTNQFTASVSFGFKLPFILPVFNTGNWVLCMPLAFYTSLYGRNGNSSESYAETLIAGYEIQKGIPGINLYLQRFGIKFGYDIQLYYNELENSNTDLRDFKNFMNVLVNSETDDYFYINLEAALSPSIGKFADSVKITAGVQFQMNIRKSKGKIAALFNMNL